MNDKLMKGIGLGATIVGAIATVVGNVVGQKQQDAKITEAATKAVSDLMNKEG